MRYEKISERLKNIDQHQLLRFYDELSDEEKDVLLDEIESIDLESYDIHKRFEQSRNISPIDAFTREEILADKERLETTGLEAIREGKLALVLLAGGQGTRLGLDGPKGTLNVGRTKELFLFEILIGNLLKVTEKAGVTIPLLIMTSEINDEITRRFFKDHDHFGYDADKIFFFVQDMAPATDMDGKFLLEEKGHVALSPNGNGGWFSSLEKAGLLEVIKKEGAEWLNVFSVDNVLQRMADPLFLGAQILSGKPVGSKVVKKASPDEKVGVMCLRDGHPSIVEYIDLTAEMMEEKNENGERAYNYGVTLNYLFRIDALEKISGESIPVHVVDKKIAYIDETGNKVFPDAPNGHKFEKLLLDMVEMMDDCLVFEVIREDEFAPIKNAHGTDSLDTAREMLEAKGVVL